jgi:hypothetical protein
MHPCNLAIHCSNASESTRIGIASNIGLIAEITSFSDLNSFIFVLSSSTRIWGSRRMPVHGNKAAGAIWSTLPLQFSKVTGQFCEFSRCRNAASPLGPSFRAKHSRVVNDTWTNYSSTECRIKSFSFRKWFDGNRSLASETDRKHSAQQMSSHSENDGTTRAHVFTLCAQRAILPYMRPNFAWIR